MSNFRFFYLEEDFYGYALKFVLSVIESTLIKQKKCRIALAGGSTPKALYKAMARAEIDWKRLHFTLTDERYVDFNNDESNMKMIEDTLLASVPIKKNQILYFDTSLPYEDSASKMARDLLALKVGEKALFDLLILGAGSDGHVASLFSEEDIKNKALAHVTTASAYNTKKRISLGFNALIQSERALLLLKGESKRAVFQSLQNQSSSTPIELLLKNVDTEVLYCE